MIVQQQIERIETPGISRRAVDLRHRLRDRRLHFWRVEATPLEPPFDDLFLARPFGDAVGIGLGPAREVFQGGDNALKLRVKLVVLKRRELFQRDLEDVTVGARSDREFVIVIAEKKRAGIEAHLQFAALQDASVLIAQDRE